MSAQQMPAAPPNPVQIFNTIQGYQRAFALKAAVDLDLFTVIAKGSRTAAEIAKTCNAAERGVRILSDALVVMGFLTKSGNSYSVTPDTAFFLDNRSPAYLGLAFKFLLHPTQLAHFEHLGTAVRNGGSSDPDNGSGAERPNLDRVCQGHGSDHDACRADDGRPAGWRAEFPAHRPRFWILPPATVSLALQWPSGCLKPTSMPWIGPMCLKWPGTMPRDTD